VVQRPGKVVKIRPNYFSTVLPGIDRNRATNYVGMFRVPNVVIWAQFSILAVVPGHGKVVKIRQKHFFAILIGNDTNCTRKSAGMFRV